MKFGIIDEVYMNTLAMAVDEFLELKPQIEKAISKVNQQRPQPFFARIINKSPTDTIIFNRHNGEPSGDVPVAWQYTWERVQIDTADENNIEWGEPDQELNTGSWSRSYDSGGQGGGEHLGSGLAYNLAEQGNKATFEELRIVFGVEIESELYPLGFFPYGANIGDIVLLHKFVSRDARALFFFTQQGTHDGTCEA